MGKLLKVNGEAIKLSVDSFDELDKECRNAEGATAESGRCSMCYPLWKERQSKK